MAGVDELAGVAGADFGSFEGFGERFGDGFGGSGSGVGGRGDSWGGRVGSEFFEVVGLDDFGAVPFGELGEAGEGVEFEPVVGFEDAEVVAAGELDSLVHTVAVAGIGLIKEADAGVGSLIGLEDGEGVVGGAVVNAEDFEIAEGLVGEGVEGLAKVEGGVVDGDENGEEGGCHKLTEAKGVKGTLYGLVAFAAVGEELGEVATEVAVDRENLAQ